MISLLLCLACPLGVLALSITNPNHALFKHAEQSSTADTFGGAYANDDNTIKYDSQLCAKTTGHDLWNWWMVDMGSHYTIRSFRITNALYCCHMNVLTCCYQLANFSIEVSAEDPKTLGGFPGLVHSANVCLFLIEPVPYDDYQIVYRCDQPVTGRYVRLVQYNPSMYKQMHLCELEVFSYYESSSKVYPPADHNLALRKPTNQSATGDGPSSRAVDGNLDGRMLYGASCSETSVYHTDTYPWWMVDLERAYVIDTVRIVNRVDSFQYRLQRLTIEVSMEHPNTYEGFPGRTTNTSRCLTQIDPIHYGVPVTLKCDRPVMGRFVRIITEMFDVLTLCEVEVFEQKELSFSYVGGSEALAGSGRENSPEARHYMTRCTREFRRNVVTLGNYEPDKPFVHVDLDDGQCRFLESFHDSKDIASVNWVVYKSELQYH